MKKTVKLYDGKITVHFNDAARNRYVIEEDGHSPVGVTTVLGLLSKDLVGWAVYEAIEYLKTHDKDWEGASKAYIGKSDAGKNVGKEVHTWIEAFIAGESTEPLSKEAQKACSAFKEWFEATQPKVLASEFIVYSKEFDYAGTADSLLEIDGKVILLDFKTTNASRVAPLGIYAEMLLQLGAYSLAHHEENPEQQIDDAGICRIGKDGSRTVLMASELGFKLSYLEDTFKQLVQVYAMLTPLKKTLTERKT